MTSTPIAGVVVDVSRLGLRVRLKSGAEVNVLKQKGLTLGHKVWVCFDYTRRTVKHVIPHDEMLAEGGVEPDPEEEDASIDVDADASDSDQIEGFLLTER